MKTLNDSNRGSWEASLYVSLFGRLSVWICLANTLSQPCSGLGFSRISCRILSREADICDLHSAVRITVLVSAQLSVQVTRHTLLLFSSDVLKDSRTLTQAVRCEQCM